MQLLRTHGGYGGWSDDDLLAIPYARFLQAVRVAGEAASKDTKGRMREAAFVGWQVATAFGSLARGTNFGSYLRSLGISDETPKMTKEARTREIERARQNSERVRLAFAKRGVA